MTANITINAIQHNNVLLLPVNAINFARLTSSGNVSSGANPGATPQLITPQAANNALNQARQMLGNLEVANPNLVSEGPTPAFVVEQSGRGYVAKPIVLGLTDGTSYEVLQGLSLSDTFIVGAN
jgi:HlyD family secretion protein